MRKIIKSEALRELRELRRHAVKVARRLRRFDPDGACSLSAACAVQDIEQAVENIDGKGVETPKDIQGWLDEAAGI